MIDNVKGYIDGVAPVSIRKNSRLQRSLFLKKTIKGTQLQTVKEVYTAEQVRFTIVNNAFVYFNFSLHQYYCKGRNDGDFTFNMLTASLARFAKEFNIPLPNAHLIGMEFGVNITTKHSPETIIARLLAIGCHPFVKTLPTKTQIAEARYEGKRLIVKVYDKGKQSGYGGKILRIEIKYRRTELLKVIGIFTLADLQDNRKLMLLGKDLFARLATVTAIPKQNNYSLLSKHNQKIIKQGITNRIWENLRPPTREKQYLWRKLREVIRTVDKLQPQLRKQVIKKWLQLQTDNGNSPPPKKSA